MVVVDGDRSADEPRARSRGSRRRRTSRSSTIGRRPSTRSSRISSAARAWLALAIPAGYGERVARGAAGDGAGGGRRHRLELDRRGAGLRASADRRLRAGAGCGRRRRAAGRRRSIDAEIRVWFNPQLESRDFMIPGMLALLLLVVTTNLSAMAIVREKELGTLEQLNVTPLRALGADRRQAAAVRADRHDRRAAGGRRRGAAGSRCRCAAASRCCSAMSLIYLLSHARPRPVHLDDLATRSSRR